VQDIHKYNLEDSIVNFSIADFTNVFVDIDGDLISHIRLTGLIIPDMGTITANQIPITWNQEISVQDISSIAYMSPQNFTDTQGFYWQAFDGTAWSHNTASAFIHLTPVADTPQLLTAIVFEDSCSEPISLKKHIMDGPEVTYFKISGIQFGKLFTYDQSQEIVSGSYISYSQAQEGIRFCPDANITKTGSFYVESSENGTQVSAQSDLASVSITV
ncbi:hypothetical protein MHK_003897, partial [Candidatus Magnetomorum sp. HK-1]